MSSTWRGPDGGGYDVCNNNKISNGDHGVLALRVVELFVLIRCGKGGAEEGRKSEDGDKLHID